MADQPRRTANITGIAGLFESGLAVVAIVAGYLLNHPPMRTIQWTDEALPGNALAVLWGGLAVVPMLAGLWVTDRLSFRPFVRLRRLVRRLVVPLFQDASVLELALISLIAGVGEELLFRGLVQDGLTTWIGGTTGICLGVAASSLVFGLAHALTRTYAVLAALVGVYLARAVPADGQPAGSHHSARGL